MIRRTRTWLATLRRELVEKHARRGVLGLTDGQQADLHRREPQRQPPGVPLEQGATTRSIAPTVPRWIITTRWRLAGGGVVGQVEALRLVEVELDGGDGLLVAARSRTWRSSLGP